MDDREGFLYRLVLDVLARCFPTDGATPSIAPTRPIPPRGMRGAIVMAMQSAPSRESQDFITAAIGLPEGLRQDPPSPPTDVPQDV